jgi:hypothetical protein
VRRWTWNILWILSQVLCVAIIALWIRSYSMLDAFEGCHKNGWFYRLLSDSGEIRLQLAPNCPWNDDWLTWLSVKNGTGGIFAVSSSSALSSPGVRWRQASMDGPWRCIDIGGPSQFSTDIGCPHWLLFLASATFPIVLAYRIGRKYFLIGHRLASGRCPHCGYDLRATPARCPECGATPPECDQNSKTPPGGQDMKR